MKLISKIASLSVGLALAVGVGVAVGSRSAKVVKATSEESVTFSEQGYANQEVISSYVGSSFTLTFDKGTNSNAPKYFTSGTAIRAYGGNTITASSTSTITSIVITFGSGDGSNAISTNVGDYSSGTWSGSSSSVVFTIGGTTGNRRLSAFTVTLEGGAPVEKHDVIFNANGTGVTGMPENLTDKSGTVSLASVASPSREGYKFKGWSLTSSGAVVDSVTVSDADVNVYAIWEEFVPTNYAETELKEGNLLITTSWDGDTYYLPTTTSSSAAPSAIKFTDVSEIDPENLWTVTSDSGSWIFQNANNDYLAITGNDNNRVRVGGTTGSWAVQEDGSLKGANDRYLGVYSGQDWRSYNSSTASNYKESAISLKFYEVSSDPSKKNMTIYQGENPAAGGTFLWSGSAGIYTFTAKEESANVSGVSWSVSDTTVATINASTGALTCVKPGNVTVYAEAEGYNKASAAIEISKSWLEDLTLSGSMSKTSYYVGEDWSHEGFTVTATYHSGWEEEVSSTASWTYSPAAPALGVTSVVVTATLEEESASSSAQSVTVIRANPLKALYSKNNGDSITAVGYYVGFSAADGAYIMDGEYGFLLGDKNLDPSEWVEGETVLRGTGTLYKTSSNQYKFSYTNLSVEVVTDEAVIAEISEPVVYSSTGNETTPDYQNRVTTVSGKVASVDQGSLTADPGTSDIKMTFTVGTNNVVVFYKKGVQDSTTMANLKAALDSNPKTEITVRGFTSWYNGFQVQMNGIVEEKEDYTAEDFAQDLIDQTDAVCVNYVDGESSYSEFKAELTTIWNDLASKDKYPSLPGAQKTILAEADRDESGTVVEQAMARYDFLTGKYNLSNFINGRTPIVPAGIMRYGELADTNNTMIIVVVIASVSALAFTTLLVFKKKKQK